MSESGDYEPASWARGHDFNAARQAYRTHADRSYDTAAASGIDPKSLVPAKISTKSQSPLVIAVDVTGSMEEWPTTIFSKLPYLDHEMKTEYLGPTAKVSFAAIGDAYSDQYPLQVQTFTEGEGLKKALEALVIEGNGGGQACESYDLAALFYARNVSMPQAITRPIFVFIGDEGLYEDVDPSQARTWANVKGEIPSRSLDVIRELQNKYSVYAIRKKYSDSSIDRTIQSQWASYIGADHIAPLQDPGRVVDVIFGILAQETGKNKYFEKELTGRQTGGQVATVMKSLETIHRGSGRFLPHRSIKRLPGHSGKSITTGLDTDEQAPDLL